jgi:O-antigen/teichoic acid export membrane protein
MLRQYTKSKLALNAAVNWIGTLAQMCAVFAVAPIMVNGLGDVRYGAWAFVESILAYLTLFDLGIGAAVVRYVSKFEGSEDHTSVNRTFTASLFMFLMAGMGVLAIAAIILGPLWIYLPIPVEHRFEAWWLFAILAFNLALGLPLGVYAAVLDGLQRYVPKTIVRIIALVARSLLLIWIVSNGGGLPAIALTVTLVAVLENIILCLFAHYYLPSLRIAPSLVNRETMKMIGSYSSHAFLAMVAGRISFQSDAIVIGVFLPLSQITYFALPARLVEHVKGALRSMTTVLTPHISKLEAMNDFAAIRKIYINGTRYILWAILPIQIGLCFFGHDFFRLWIGEDHADAGYEVLVTLSSPLAIVLSQSIAGRILYGIGEVGVVSKTRIIEAVFNLLLSIALVSHFGILGVAFGTVLPNIIGTLFIIRETCRRLSIPWFQYVNKAATLPLALNAIYVACFLFLLPKASIQSWSIFFATTGVSYAFMFGLGLLCENLLVRKAS